MPDPVEIQAVTCAWTCGVGHTRRGMRLRAAATYHPTFPLRYTTSQPFWLLVPGGWALPREWLQLALDGEQAGVFDAECGNLQIVREAAELRVEMRGPDGDAVLWLPVAAVRELLGRSLVLVPLGAEFGHIDWSGVAWGSAA